jgi:signal peptidase II
VRKRLLVFVPVLLVSLALDQLTKAWAREALEPGATHAVIGSFWHWRLSFNTGMAFSLGHNSGLARVLLPVVAVIATGAVTWMALRTPEGRRVEVVALALVGSGALGNVIDRLMYGKVTDFVLWKAFGYSWPVFNVADVALVVGVAVLLLWRGPRAETTPATPA